MECWGVSTSRGALFIREKKEEKNLALDLRAGLQVDKSRRVSMVVVMVKRTGRSELFVGVCYLSQESQIKNQNGNG